MTVQLPYILLYLFSVLLAAVSQVLLKIAAMRPHDSVIAEYLDWRVLFGYGLFFGCTLLTMFAYRGIPLSLGPVLESTSYLYVTVLGTIFFREKFNKRKLLSLVMIICGILLYSL